jgi:transposase
VVDALGLPVAFEITAGHRHDSQSALSLIATINPNCLLGDKAYDVDAIREHLRANEAQAVIPPKANRKTAIAFDAALYKARSAIECTINLLKQARRFATRYEKLHRRGRDWLRHALAANLTREQPPPPSSRVTSYLPSPAERGRAVGERPLLGDVLAASR